MSETEFLEIDGSVLEGGGQILRISIALSAILGIPVRLTKIRNGRSKAGMAMQHLKGIQLVAEMCGAKLNGGRLGATEIEFIPGKLKGGHYEADTKTAGSISLLLQIALPCALFADGPVTLSMRGGTNAAMAPPIDFMTEVFLRTLRKFGADFNLNILRRGYFPKGGGHVVVNVNPVRQIRNVNIIERGTISSIQGWSFVAGNLPIKMTYEAADGAKAELPGHEVNIKCYKEGQAFATGSASGIVLVSETTTGCRLGSDALVERGARAAAAGGAAGRDLRAAIASGACLGDHLQDQVIIYMALAAGRSVVRVGKVSMHTKTAIYLTELMAKTNFNIEADGDQNLIECSGIGFTNENIPE